MFLKRFLAWESRNSIGGVKLYTDMQIKAMSRFILNQLEWLLPSMMEWFIRFLIPYLMKPVPNIMKPLEMVLKTSVLIVFLSGRQISTFSVIHGGVVVRKHMARIHS